MVGENSRKTETVAKFPVVSSSRKKIQKKNFRTKIFAKLPIVGKFFIISEIRFLKFRAIVEEMKKMALLPKPAKRLGLESLSPK